VEIRWLGVDDAGAVITAGELFDDPPSPQWTNEFLSRPGHHLGLAVVDEAPAGFITGVEMTHPDKGTEMFLYELGVGEAYRGRGIGRALVQALADRAQELGCYGMWVLADADNEVARRTYRSAGGTEQKPSVMIDWRFDTPGSASVH
jgi:ribosomal protein S18 acetylase RimI-like enzyme